MLLQPAPVTSVGSPADSARKPVSTYRAAERLPYLTAKRPAPFGTGLILAHIPEPNQLSLQPQGLLQRGDATAADGDLLFHAVEREQQRAAGDGLDLLDHGQVHQVAAVHAEEPMAVQALLQLRQADGAEVAVRVGLQIRVGG